MLVIKANSGITGYQGVLYFNSDKECPDFKNCFQKLSSAKAIAVQTITTANPETETKTR